MIGSPTLRLAGPRGPAAGECAYSPISPPGRGSMRGPGASPRPPPPGHRDDGASPCSSASSASPRSGKTTLFNILTASHQATDKFAASRQTNVGVAQVPDARLVQAARPLQAEEATRRPRSSTWTSPACSKGEGAESLDLGKLRTVDALVHVVRAFDDPEIPHAAGSVDPARDLLELELELILADHELVERRLERLEQAAKRGLKPGGGARAGAARRRRAAGARGRAAAARGRARRRRRAAAARLPAPLGQADAGGAQRRRGATLAGADPGAHRAGRRARAPRRWWSRRPIEQEIAGLAEPSRREFLAELGLAEPSLDRVIRASYELLGLISFFTVGEDEVRAWTIRRGTRAREAAGAIHSDIERGFIRAEVVRWEDLVRLRLAGRLPHRRLAPPGGQGVRGPGRRRDPLPLQRLGLGPQASEARREYGPGSKAR